MRILLVGTWIVPYRNSSEKNFWLDMIRGLQQRGHDLEVLSVMSEDIPNRGLPLRRVPPVPFRLWVDGRVSEEYSHLADTINYASKTASMPRIAGELRRRRKAFRPDVIHFMESFGPAMAGLRLSLGRLPLTITAFTYQPNHPLYHLFLRASLTSFDAIVALSEALRGRLLEMRYPPSRIRRIRWGIDVNRFVPPTGEAKATARERFAIGPDTSVVLWNGFLQQMGEPDLRFAIRTAELILQKAPSRFAFLFCFKPQCFHDAYRKLERPGLRIFSSPEEFRAARTAADVYLSPIDDVHSTATPPLTWLECLAMGIPIVTTGIPGTEEVVISGESGFTAPTPEAASERIQEIAADSVLRRRLREGARRIAVDRYSLVRALDEYEDLWSTVVNGSPPRRLAWKRAAAPSAPVPPQPADTHEIHEASTFSK